MAIVTTASLLLDAHPAGQDVLLLDEDGLLRSGCVLALVGQGYYVSAVATPGQARVAFANRVPAVFLSDYDLGRGATCEPFFEWVATRHPGVRRIVLSADHVDAARLVVRGLAHRSVDKLDGALFDSLVDAVRGVDQGRGRCSL
jgi:hypothetical protein